MTVGTEMTPEPSRAMLRRDLKAKAARRPARRRRRGRGALSVFGALAVAAMAVAYVSPLGAALSASASQQPVPPVTLYTSALGDAQTVSVSSEVSVAPSLDRSGYTVYIPPQPKPVVVAATATARSTAPATQANTNALAAPLVAPNPGSAQSIAYAMVKARGWNDQQFSCLVALWNRESGWRVNAYNPSGAYGIPQALPGSKMASAGADWATNPATQIAWGLGYISGSYGTPCAAWGHSNATGWY